MSTTILYLRHNVEEQLALERAVSDAKNVLAYKKTTDEQRPSRESKLAVEVQATHVRLLESLLDRYKGSLAAVGK